MADPEKLIRRFEDRRAREPGSSKMLLQRAGEGAGALLLFAGVLYWAMESGSRLLALIATLAGGFGYMILRRLWTLEDRLWDLEQERRRREGPASDDAK